MSLRQFNIHLNNNPIPQGWIPDKRFIHYEYKPLILPEHCLRQDLISPVSTSLQSPPLATPLLRPGGPRPSP